MKTNILWNNNPKTEAMNYELLTLRLESATTQHTWWLAQSPETPEGRRIKADSLDRLHAEIRAINRELTKELKRSVHA
jgi:hypothetical protein